MLHLSNLYPKFVEYTLLGILLYSFHGLSIKIAGLTSKLSEKPDFLAVCYLLLEEDFLALSQHDGDQGLYSVTAQVGRGSMQEILIDVGEHAGCRLEGVIGRLEACILETVLVCGVA